MSFDYTQFQADVCKSNLSAEKYIVQEYILPSGYTVKQVAEKIKALRGEVGELVKELSDLQSRLDDEDYLANSKLIQELYGLEQEVIAEMGYTHYCIEFDEWVNSDY